MSDNIRNTQTSAWCIVSDRQKNVHKNVAKNMDGECRAISLQ